jgi:hypothetical protein
LFTELKKDLFFWNCIRKLFNAVIWLIVRDNSKQVRKETLKFSIISHRFGALEAKTTAEEKQINT